MGKGREVGKIKEESRQRGHCAFISDLSLPTREGTQLLCWCYMWALLKTDCAPDLSVSCVHVSMYLSLGSVFFRFTRWICKGKSDNHIPQPRLRTHIPSPCMGSCSLVGAALGQVARGNISFNFPLQILGESFMMNERTRKKWKPTLRF